MSCDQSEDFSPEKWSAFIDGNFATEKAAAAFFGVHTNTIHNWRHQISEPRLRHLLRARKIVCADKLLDAICGDP